MKIKTRSKPGGIMPNHKQTQRLKVKSGVNGGWWPEQHNQTMAHGLKVKTGIKAGPPPGSTGSGGSGTGN